jgi:hypothetical protein
MMTLFQQFLASIANKEDSKGVAKQTVDVNVTEKQKLEKESSKDVAESSAQGEARGNHVNNSPYCYRCLTRGHAKEECIVSLFCGICESTTHVKGRLPAAQESG